jgi:hypothetical protein
VVSADGVADLGLLLVLLGEAHAQQGVRQIGFFFGNLADIVQEPGALGDLRVQAQFGGHDGADVRDFAGVLQEVLAVGGTVFHAADQADQLHRHAMDAQVDAGALAGLEDLVFQLFLDLVTTPRCGLDGCGRRSRAGAGPGGRPLGGPGRRRTA